MKSVLLEDARLKVSADVQTDTRVLDFYAATFSPMPDRMGDKIAPDAFDTWLAAFYAKGDPLPISFAHAAIREDTDPGAIIGYAPASPSNVWVDQVGLRIKAFVYTDTETSRQVARLIDSGVVRSASLAMFVGTDVVGADGSRTITDVKAVKEAGPCMYPANPEATVLSLKSLVHHTETTDEPWEGALYRERLSEGDEVNSFKVYAWRDADAFAFLHHVVSNDGIAGAANLEACSAIIDVLNGGRKVDLKAQPWIGDRAPIYDHAAAHLKDAGVSEIPELKAMEDEPAVATEPVTDPVVDPPTDPVTELADDEIQALLLKHAGPGYVQQIHDIAMRAGAACGSEKTEPHDHIEARTEVPPTDDAPVVPDVDELISQKAVHDPETEVRMMKIRRIKALHVAAPSDALSYPDAVTKPQVTDEPMPEGVPALKTHLGESDHEMTASAVDVEPEDHLRVVHKRLHDTTDTGHTHPGMKYEQMDNVRATLRRLRVMKAGVA